MYSIKKLLIMNIVEAMTKFNAKYVILLSGLSGSGRSKIAKFIAEKFKFQLFRLFDYAFPKDIFDSPQNYVKLNDSTSVLAWDDINKSIDWEKFNSEINEKMKNGIVAYGNGFPKTQITFVPDVHIHLKITKEKLIERRHSYLKKHPSNPNADFVGTDTENQIFNKITYPCYLKARDDANIDRYISVNEITEAELKNTIFRYLMDITQRWLDKNDKSKTQQKEDNKTHETSKNNQYDTYYHNKHIKNYDFNDEGIDYPDDPEQKSDVSESSVATSDSDVDFLMTSIS